MPEVRVDGFQMIQGVGAERRREQPLLGDPPGHQRGHQCRGIDHDVGSRSSSRSKRFATGSS